MTRSFPILLIAAMLGTASGCGTMLNLDNKERLDLAAGSVVTADGKPMTPRWQRPAFAFGGVANDIAWIKSAEQPFDVVHSLVDMPFSLVGDVVTLPWAFNAAKNFNQQKAQRDEWQKFWLEESPKSTLNEAAAPK